MYDISLFYATINIGEVVIIVFADIYIAFIL